MTIEKAQPSSRAGRGLSRRPLTASKADQAMFVNRAAEADTILKAVDLDLNSYVWGPPGSGKTSLLRHVQATLDAHARPVIYVNVETVASVEAAIAVIADAIDPDKATGSPGESPDDETAVALIEQALERRGGEDPVVVLVDGVDADVTAVLFGRYRDRLWESPQVRWVVAGRDASLTPPADAFFDRVVPLGPLSTQAAAELLERRAGWIDETVRARLVDAVGPAQPVLWILATQSIAITGDPAPVIDALASQRATAENLPDRLGVLYDALVDLGPVHAGDHDLLERVSASRPWVVTGLKELKEQGLVRSQRHGRRVLYETVRTGLVSSFDPSAMHVPTDARGEG